MAKAKDYLKQNQKDAGGWDNVSSTAWAMEGILALSEKPEDWIKNNNNPLDYLASMQDADGGTKNDDKKSKLWETAYVATALSGKTWNQIMQKFEKPKEEVKIENKIITKKLTKKIAPQNKIISETIRTANQTESAVIRPASTSTLSAFLRFFISVLDKIL